MESFAPEDYEATQRELIAALHTYKDEETGRHPFTLAVTRADAEMFNLQGDLVGDVVYALRPEFDGAHGKTVTFGEFWYRWATLYFYSLGCWGPTRDRIAAAGPRR